MIVQRFDKQTWKIDLYEVPPPEHIHIFVNKKSIPLVSEVSYELLKVLKLVKLQTLTALVSLPEDEQFLRQELGQVAEALFKGASVMFIDTKKQVQMVEGLGLKGPFPKLTFSELEPGQSIDFYQGFLNADEIRIWA